MKIEEQEKFLDIVNESIEKDSNWYAIIEEACIKLMKETGVKELKLSDGTIITLDEGE